MAACLLRRAVDKTTCFSINKQGFFLTKSLTAGINATGREFYPPITRCKSVCCGDVGIRIAPEAAPP